MAPGDGSAAAPLASRPVLYIAGDVHLQGEESGAAPFLRFLDMLAALPPARLVLLGDLFEYWLETGSAERRYHETLARLRALRQAGWRLDLVRGNRELAGGRLLASRTGCELHWPKLDLALGGARVRVVHGDRLCHDPGYHFFSAWIRSFWHRGWQELHPPFVQDAVARSLRRRSRSKHLARARSASVPPAARRRVFIDRRRVQAVGRGVDTVVAGHIHESWRRELGGVDLVLVGDWPGTTGHWVEGYGDGRLERIEREFT